MKTLYNLLKEKPYLAWYIQDKENLSEESIVEHILNYGDWDDFLKTEEAMGIDKVESIFNKLKNKKRVNLRPKTINYFTNYFQRYA